jgi:hypothetical protein
MLLIQNLDYYKFSIARLLFIIKILLVPPTIILVKVGIISIR